VKNKMAKRLQNRNVPEPAAQGPLDPNELKNIVRDGLVAMDISQRAAFISELGTELKRLHLDIRAYLVPLGIPGRSPEDLTPTEVGHLVRFLKLNVPNAMRGVEKALARHGIIGNGTRAGDRLAA
jgi:hypothetical protein